MSINQQINELMNHSKNLRYKDQRVHEDVD